jgi:TolB-like protein/Tfp pilus assembly protein PilF
MSSFFEELKRRNVYKVAAAYAVVGWLIIQIATQTFPFLEIPSWAPRLVILLVIIGFPVALMVAWAFQLTPQGVKRTDAVDETATTHSAGHGWIYVAVVAGLMSGGLFFLGRYSAPRETSQVTTKSIAVLPFENRSEDKANAFFADGIQDEILTRLAKIAELKVISRTSTLRYKSSPENLPQIAKELGVAHVLEGSVQKAGESVRVTVQLIHGGTDSHVWAETYDRKLTDILAVESEIAATIAHALQAKLTPGEQLAVTAKPTENPAAYEAYLRGLAVWNKLSSAPSDFEDMIKSLSLAVELDPKFALAWAYLSVAQSYEYREFDPTPQRAAAAKEAYERALRLQPELGEAHFAQGMYFYKVPSDYDAALQALEKARERSGNRAMAIEFCSYVKRRQGKWDDALRLHAESIEIDPRNPIILSEAGMSYRALRRFAEAQVLVDRAREIAPDSSSLLVLQAELSLAQGDLATADRLLQGVTIDGSDPTVTMAYALLQSMKRQYPKVIRTLESVLEKPEKLPPGFTAIAANYRAELAIVHALAGNSEAPALLSCSKEELAAIHAAGGETNWSTMMLLLVSGFLKDAATVDSIASQLQEKIVQDAVSANALGQAIAIARVHLGQTEEALKEVKTLLQTVGEGSLTPGLLRLDPLWDPLRSDPRFQALAMAK